MAIQAFRRCKYWVPQLRSLVGLGIKKKFVMSIQLNYQPTLNQALWELRS